MRCKLLKIFDLETLQAVLLRERLFIPPEVFIAFLLESGKLVESRAPARCISSKKYLAVGELADIESVTNLMKKGHYLCVSGDIGNKLNLPKIDEVFESLMNLAEEEIILVAPYASSEFMSDLGSKITGKRNLITIITNSPESKLSNKSQRGTIDKLIKMGFKVKITKRDVHAKIYIFDRKAALLGSSNLSRNGFFDYDEIGTVVFGSECLQLKSIVDQIADDEIPISVLQK